MNRDKPATKSIVINWFYVFLFRLDTIEEKLEFLESKKYKIPVSPYESSVNEIIDELKEELIRDNIIENF